MSNKGTAGVISSILTVAAIIGSGGTYGIPLALAALGTGIIENDYQSRRLKAQFDKMGSSQFAGSPSYSWDRPQTVSNPSIPVPLAFGTCATGGNIINSWTETVNVYQTKWDTITPTVVSQIGYVNVIRTDASSRGVKIRFNVYPKLNDEFNYVYHNWYNIRYKKTGDPSWINFGSIDVYSEEREVIIVNPDGYLNNFQWDVEITLVQSTESYPTQNVAYWGTVWSAHENTSDTSNVAGSKDYQYLVVGLAKGEINNIKNIKLNNNPISNYSKDYYLDAYRYGTNEQPPIEWADKVITETLCNYQLLYNVSNPTGGQTTQNSDVTEIVIILNFPSGLYSVDSKGKYQNWQVDVVVETRLSGSSGAWTAFPTKSIIGKNINPFKNAVKYSLPSDKYDVRIRKTSLDPNPTGSPATVGDVYWYSMQEYVSESLSYPNTAIAAYRILASDTMSGSTPQFYFELDGRIIDVPNLTVSGNTIQYEQAYWDGTNYRLMVDNTVCVDTGTFVKQWTTNPVWIVRNLCLSSDGLGDYITSMTDSELRILAKYCDEYIADGKGGQEKRFKLDGILDSQGDARNWLETILEHFRGYYVWSEGKLKLKIYKPDVSVQLFTMGNIIENSLVMNYASAKDKFNGVKISHADKDNEYKLTDIYIYDTTTTKPTKVQDISLPMITRRSQAVRMGRYILNKNKDLSESIQFGAAIDAIACEAGDIIEFAHDVCGYGLVSGRIKASTINSITLDAPVTIVSGTYNIKVKLADDSIEERTISNGVGTYYTISTTTNFTSIPPVDSLYSVGLVGKVTKPYRVINISRSNNQERKVTALEENSSIYSDTGDNIVRVDYSSLPNPLAVPASVLNLTAKEMTYDPGDGTKINKVMVAWSAPDDDNYDRAKIYLSENAGAFWEYKGESKGNFLLNNLDKITYKIAVASVSKYGISQTVSNSSQVSITVQGKTTNPSDVSFSSVVFGADIILKWNPISDTDLAFYEIRTANNNWGVINSNLVWQGNGNSFIFKNPPLTSYTFYIKARDTSGNYSTNAGAYNVGNAAPSLGTVSSDFTGQDLRLWWSPVYDDDLKEYHVYIYKDPGRTQLLRSESIQDTNYTYTFEYNKVDNSPSAPQRTLYITVKAIDNLNQESSQLIIVNNPAPSTPTGLTGTPIFAGIWLTWNVSTDTDVIGYRIYVNDVAIDRVSSPSYMYSGAKIQTQYSFKVSAIDVFGEGNFGPTIYQTTLSVESAENLGAVYYNYVRNPSAEYGDDGWENNAQFTIDTTNARVSGTKCWKGIANATILMKYSSYYIETKPGDQWYVSGWAKCPGGSNGNVGLGIAEYDINKVLINNTSSPDFPNAPSNSYTKVFTTITNLQPTTKYIRFYWYIWYTTTYGTWYFDDAEIRAIIIGDMIAANSIYASKIKVGETFVIDNTGGAGIIMSGKVQSGTTPYNYWNLATGDFSLGNNTKSYLHYDPSTTPPQLNLEGSINLTGGNAFNQKSIFTETWDGINPLSNWTNYSSGEQNIINTGGVSGGKYLEAGSNSGDDQWWGIYNYNIPFDPNKLYRIKVRLRRTAGTGVCYIGWVGVGSDGTTLVNQVGANATSDQHYTTSGVSPASTWTDYIGYAKGFGATDGQGGNGSLSNPRQLHPNVRYVRPFVVINYPNSSGYTDIDSIIIDDVSETLPGYASITLDAKGNIKSGQTAYNTGTGWWIGQDTDGVSKLSIGNSSGNSITWNGTTLNVPAVTVTGTLTSATIDVGNLTGTTITGKTIQTAAPGTGARIQITANDNEMKWYDTSGGLIAQIGGLTTTQNNYRAWFYNSVSGARLASFNIYSGSVNGSNIVVFDGTGIYSLLPGIAYGGKFSSTASVTNDYSSNTAVSYGVLGTGNGGGYTSSFGGGFSGSTADIVLGDYFTGTQYKGDTIKDSAGYFRKIAYGISGTVASDGTITSGTGFTVSHPSGGTYNISFTNNFASVPTVIATIGNTNNGTTLRRQSVTTSGFTIVTMTGSGQSIQDSDFSFFAIVN